MQRTRTYSREEHTHIELIAEKALGEFPDGRINGLGRLAHCGRDKWNSVLAADQMRDFGGTAALKRDYLETCEGHRF
jgi:hypothetical protein